MGASQLALARRIEEDRQLGISEYVQDASGLRKRLERIENGEQERTSLIRQKIDILQFRIGVRSDEGFGLLKVYGLAREVLGGRYTCWGNGWHALAKDGAKLLTRGKLIR